MSRSAEETRSGATGPHAMTQPSGGTASPGPSRRTLLLGAVVGFPASAVLLMLSVRSLDGNALRASVRGADTRILALAFCASSLVYVVQAARWRLIAQTRPPVASRKLLDWTFGAIAVNNVVPGRPGDLLRVEWLSRGAEMPRARALATVALDRGLDLVVLVAAFAVTYPAVEHARWLDRLGAGGGLVAALVVLLFLAATAYARRAKPAAAGRLTRLLADVAREARGRLRGRRGAAALFLSLVAWGTWAASAWLVASSLGITLGPLDLLFITAVINLGVAIPSSPGFIGTYQWLGVSALGVLGVNHTNAFAFSVLMHAAWFVPTTLAGAVLILRKVPPVLAGVLADRASQSNAA
jgi:glycosyltransferase 2 family protein